MPDSGPVVKALERVAAHDGRCCTWSQELAEVALPLAREQEALLRAYVENHRTQRQGGALLEGRRPPEECPCTLCERARKVLP